MGQKPLENYLRTYRRRLSLSQEDVAFLVGFDSDTTISHHERGRFIPTLDFLIAYEIVLGAPLRDLFAGKFDFIEADIKKRAVQLIKAIEQQPPSALKTRKLEVLSSLAGLEEPVTYVLWDR